MGWTYSEIMEVLPVVKGALAAWCHEIRLSEEQVHAIRTRRPPGIRTGIPVDTQRKRRAEIEKIKKAAALDAVHLLSDPLWLAGVVLYWAEGSKTKRGLEVTNTDERALRLFMRWTTSYLIPDASFVLALHLHEGNNDESARQHWASRLGLDDPDFDRTFIKPAGTIGRTSTHTASVE